MIYLCQLSEFIFTTEWKLRFQTVVGVVNSSRKVFIFAFSCFRGCYGAPYDCDTSEKLINEIKLEMWKILKLLFHFSLLASSHNCQAKCSSPFSSFPIFLCIIQIFRIHFLYSLLFTFRSALRPFFYSYRRTRLALKLLKCNPPPNPTSEWESNSAGKSDKELKLQEKKKKVVCWEKHFGKWIMIAHSTSQESS